MKKIKLLLADNHQIMMDGIQAFLEKDPNLEVAAVALNGEEALHALERQPVDIAILDIEMPVMTGLEAAKHIRKRFPHTKIILLTTYSEPQFIRSALRLHIQGYIIKDKSKETLQAAIYAVMKGNRYYPMEVDLVDILTGPELPDEDRPIQLTKREIEIICLMMKHPSWTSKEIADALYIVPVTVEKHQQNAKKKIGVHRNAELILYAKDKKLCT